MLVSFNKFRIILFKNKITSNEDFEEVHKVVHDGISVNMKSLVQTGKCGAINEVDTKTMVYYIVEYISDSIKTQ